MSVVSQQVPPGRPGTQDADGEPVPAYRAFHVRVARVASLGPSFARVTFTGPDLHLFADNGLDQRIKLVLPLPGGHSFFPEGDDWYRRWRELPAHRRNPIRTYTVRAVRQDRRELDVDFVLHGVEGPASRWALSARPGDPLVVVGPDVRHRGDAGGREWAPPAGASRLLIAGDECAAPAVCAIAESLPDGVRAQVLLEVPDPGDVRPVRVAPGVRVTWLPRRGSGTGTPAHGDLLTAAVHEAVRDLAPGAVPAAVEDVDVDTAILWEVPQASAARARDGFYAWLAGEAGVVKRLRRHLVGELGVDRSAVAFMGYWRLGRAETD
ncbi:siderophore-interacting protein [Sphaerisporangium fuscum]|uniref:siderophore-interacting protein n=1 Tax=Sphaerisporangium fuscum TaxID=2835868 RepID=UPI001BDC7DE7|nr:siderophore-interacting protein [Sphaerisporangium fuscum]